MLLRYIALFRVAWLAGRYGGGKTSLALHLASELVGSGEAQYVCSNFPLNRGRLVRRYSDYEEVAERERGAVIIFDEAWLELGQSASPKAVNKYLAYLRHHDLFLLLPSVLPLARTVRVVQVSRLFNGLVFGLPFWLYDFRVDCGMNKPEVGRYTWWLPQRVWGWYDTTNDPGLSWYVYDWSGVAEDNETEEGRGFGATVGADNPGGGGDTGGGDRGVSGGILESV